MLGRRRILIYTLPPVEASCVLCYVAADLCFELQCDASYSNGVDGAGDHPPNGEELPDTDAAVGGETSSLSRLRGRSREGITVLGMVTLNDLDKMHHEGKSGRGWIACKYTSRYQSVMLTI